MPNFCIKPAREDEVLSPQIRISQEYYDSHFDCISRNLPIVIARLI